MPDRVIRALISNVCPEEILQCFDGVMISAEVDLQRFYEILKLSHFHDFMKKVIHSDGMCLRLHQDCQFGLFEVRF